MPVERRLFLHATRHNNNAAIIMWNSSRAGLFFISPSRARVRQADATLRILESWVAASVHRTSRGWNSLTVGLGAARRLQAGLPLTISPTPWYILHCGIHRIAGNRLRWQKRSR